MATTADLIAETKRHLDSMARPPMNKLAGGIAADSTSVTFLYDTAQIQAGAYLEVGLELMYVWQVNTSAKTAVVERAQLGSTAAAHTDGARVTINPRFPDFTILKALNDDLLDLSSPWHGLFAVRSVDLTASANSRGYDLAGATDLLEILDIRQKHQGFPRDWTPVTNFELHRQTSTTDFPSGLGLTLAEGTRSGQPIRVLYKASFGTLSTLTDDVTAVAGLPRTMMDIPPLGAAMRLVAPREVRRNFTDSQGDSRRSEEVPPGAAAASLRPLATLRQTRITAEASRLAMQHPDRSFTPPQVTW